MGRQQLLFKYPPDLQKAQKHRLAKRIFKGVEKDPACEQCECCDRKIGVEIVQSNCCYDKNDLAFLGPGIPLLFAYIRNCILLLLVLTLIFAGFCFYSNFSSEYCHVNTTNCEYNIFNTISFANKMNASDLLSIQNYILLAFVVVNILLFQFFRYNFRKIQEECDDIVNSPSDYAIILRRLPENTTKEHIQKMIEGRRADLNDQERLKTQNLRIDHIVLSYAMGEYTKIKQKNKENFKKSIDEGKHAEFTPEPFPKLTETAKLAIVVFARQQSKQFFLYKPSIPQKFLQLMCDPCTPLSNFVVNGQRVSIERAPEPDDVVWENSKISISGGIIRKSIFNVLGFIVLGIGGGAQYALAALQNTVTDPTQKQIYSIGLSILVSIFNFIILQFLIFSSHRERNETLTEYNTVLTVKISLFQFLNTGIFVVLANFLADMGSFSITQSLPTDVTIVMLMNAISPNVTLWALNYFEIIGKVYRWLIRTEKIKVTQLEANETWQGPPPQIPYKYAYVLKTIWLTAFYAPLVPVVVPISMLGLTLNYFIEKHLYRYVYSVPNMLSSMVNDSAVELMEYFPLIISLGEFIIYCYMKNYDVVALPQNWSIPIYISLALSFLNLALPMDELNNCIKLRIDSQQNPPYEKVEEKFQVTYEMTNPAYECKKKRKRDVFLFNLVFGGQGKNAAINMSDLIGIDQTGRSLVRDPLLNKNTSANQNNNILINLTQQNGEVTNTPTIKQGDTTMNTSKLDMTQDNLNKSVEEQANPFAAFMKLNMNNSVDNGQKPPTLKEVTPIPMGLNNLQQKPNQQKINQDQPVGKNESLMTGNVLPRDLLQDVNNNNSLKKGQEGQVNKLVSPSGSSASYKNLTKDLNFKYNNSSSPIPTNINQVPAIPFQNKIQQSQPQKKQTSSQMINQGITLNQDLQSNINPQPNQSKSVIKNSSQTHLPQNYVPHQDANLVNAFSRPQKNVQPSNSLNPTIPYHQPSQSTPQIKNQTSFNSPSNTHTNTKLLLQPPPTLNYEPTKIASNEPQITQPTLMQFSEQQIQPQIYSPTPSILSHEPQNDTSNHPQNLRPTQQAPDQMTYRPQNIIQAQPQNSQQAPMQTGYQPQNTQQNPQIQDLNSQQGPMQMSYQPQNNQQNQKNPQIQAQNSQQGPIQIPYKNKQINPTGPMQMLQQLQKITVAEGDNCQNLQVQMKSEIQNKGLVGKSQNENQRNQDKENQMKDFRKTINKHELDSGNAENFKQNSGQHNAPINGYLLNEQKTHKQVINQYNNAQELKLKKTIDNDKPYLNQHQTKTGGQNLFNSLVQIKQNLQSDHSLPNNQTHQSNELLNPNTSNQRNDPAVLLGKNQLTNLPYKYPNQLQSNHHEQSLNPNHKIYDLSQVSQPQIDNYLLNQPANQGIQLQQSNPKHQSKQTQIKIPLLSLAARLQSINTTQAKKPVEKSPPPKNKTYAQAFPHYLKQKQMQKNTRNKFIEEGLTQLEYENKKFTKSGAIFFQTPKSTQKSHFPHVQIHVPGVRPVTGDDVMKTSENRRNFGRNETDRKQVRRNQSVEKESNGEFTAGQVYNPRFQARK